MNQVIFPLDLEFKLQKNDVAYTVNNVVESIPEEAFASFVQFRCQLVEEKLTDAEAIFIDGTKIDANANKYTFVWRKSIDRYNELRFAFMAGNLRKYTARSA